MSASPHATTLTGYLDALESQETQDRTPLTRNVLRRAHMHMSA